MKPSNTTRTDGLVDRLINLKPALWRDWSDSQLKELEQHARQLERELNAQIEENSKLKEHINTLTFGVSALVYKKP